MSDNKSIDQKIYDASSEELENLAYEKIKQATDMIEDYAIKVIKRSDLKNNRWILINLLHVLYKDIFLLQTDDLENIFENKFEIKNGEVKKQCNICNKDLLDNIYLKGVEDNQEVEGLCLDCFISTVEDADWWDETWARVRDKL